MGTLTYKKSYKKSYKAPIKLSKIAVLVSSVLTLLPASMATAAEVEETITVTGSRFDRSAEQQLMVINTIEREEIERLNPKSVADVLEILPGVSVSRNGGPGQNTSISIRGSNSNHVLVLIDGVKIGSATLGAVSFNTLSPENIERVEVLKGPRASIWGSDAIGGVIQIFTRQLKEGEWFASTEYGSNDYIRGTLGFGVNHGEGSTSFSVNHEQSDGYDVYNGSDVENDDDGYQRSSFSLKGSQPINQYWQALWNAQYDKGTYQYDDTFASGSADESDYENYLWNLGAKYRNESFISKLTLSQSRDYNENFRGDNTNVPTNIYETTRDQINWSNQYTVTNGLILNGGIDWSREEISGDYEQNQRDIIGVYGLLQQQWNKLLIEVAVRYDDVENIDSELSYNTSLAYQFNAQWRLSATTGTSFKAPTFNDLYWPNSGNPDLLSETAKNYDLTLNYQVDNLVAYVSLFQNQVDNLITWASTGEMEVRKPVNINKAEMSGAELSANYQLFNLEHQLSYTYLKAEDTQTDEQLIGRSKHDFSYLLSYEWQQFDLLANYHYQGERYAGYGDFFDSYQQLDLSVGYHIDNRWTLRLKANNLLDETIISAKNYLSPSRELFFSVNYQAF
ncbi:TonB-dependent receptor [Shewanella sp. VB17]|uniref:TonB-dependent receptor domain-containing protein n=1 Tax=Shewanella sp. VB17 TaxID=2739432 RepID=UPI00156757BD|nr:TonB-dependent receptor [Shewanella sp. VB17]NRD75118.1 TonB-dependent receptor [Shewanella sp. VB17]